MRKLIPMTSALALGLALAGGAMAQEGRGGDRDDRREARQERGEDRRERKDDRREERRERAEDRRENRQERREVVADRRDDARERWEREARRATDRRDWDRRDWDRRGRGDDDDDDDRRRVDRGDWEREWRRVRDERRRDWNPDWRNTWERRERERRDWYDTVLIRGCPPGLARQGNGCVPPGLARQIRYDTRYNSLWDRWDDGYRYRYNDGYLYRSDNSGSLLGYLPLLGGALGLGQIWPQQYAYQAPDPYYTRYYGLNDAYRYRQADNVLYQLDPQTQAIQQVSALLTGQQWTVGQTMPAGYDVYNVPYDYRDQYYDRPDRWYRYDDGYVYQVDPTTQLVQSVIQLIA